MKYKIGDKFRYNNTYIKLLSFTISYIAHAYDEKGKILCKCNYTEDFLDSYCFKLNYFPWEKECSPNSEHKSKCEHDWKVTISPFSGTKWKDCKKCGMKWEDYEKELKTITGGKGVDINPCATHIDFNNSVIDICNSIQPRKGITITNLNDKPVYIHTDLSNHILDSCKYTWHPISPKKGTIYQNINGEFMIYNGDDWCEMVHYLKKEK